MNQPEPGKLEPNSLYLVDSGGQYPDGTTDITRTIAIGKPSHDMIQQFTLVLKGHIGLANAIFPHGTTGHQLDILARQHLWANGYNFDHGTGHGVGHFLSVHEGLKESRLLLITSLYWKAWYFLMNQVITVLMSSVFG